MTSQPYRFNSRQHRNIVIVIVDLMAALKPFNLVEIAAECPVPCAYTTTTVIVNAIPSTKSESEESNSKLQLLMSQPNSTDLTFISIPALDMTHLHN